LKWITHITHIVWFLIH